MKFDVLAFIGKHSKATLVIILLITLFFLYHASSLTLDADYGSLMTAEEGKTYIVSSSNKVAASQAESFAEEIPQTTLLKTDMLAHYMVASNGETVVSQESEVAYTTSYLVMLESDNLFTAKNLTLIRDIMTQLGETEYLSKPYSVLGFVTLEKRGSRLTTVPFSNQSYDQPFTEEQASLLYERVKNDPIVKNYLISEDMRSMLFSFESISLSKEQEHTLSMMMQPLRDAGLKVYINGGAVLTNLLMHYLGRDLSILLTLCCIAILVVYYLSFRAKRSVLLPFSMSVIGIIWTFGTMKLLGYSLTIVNIVTPCMVLNLGSSYAIHVIGEYYTDYAKGMNSVQSTKKILRTIFFACMTTVIGFLSLLFSQTAALREFGVAVGFGITYCAILASTYLPAQLSLVEPPKKIQIKTYKKGYLAQTVSFFDRLVQRRWQLFILVWLLIIGGYLLTRDHIPINTNYMSYLPQKDPFTQESRYFAQRMGGDTPYIITIEAPEQEAQFFLKSENLQHVYNFEQAIITQLSDVRQILSFASYVSFANKVYSDEVGIPTSSGLLNLINRMVILLSKQGGKELSNILSAEGDKLTIFLQNYDSQDQDLMTIASAQRIEEGVVGLLDLLPDGSKVTLGGEPHRVLHFSDALLKDQRSSIYFSYLLVFLVVFLAFRSISLASYSLIPILSGVMANYVFMYFFKIPFDMITVSFAAVAVGAGIDDAIHFLIRYKNKLTKEPQNISALLSETIQETGRPIFLTTLSIVAGMMMFLFASYTPVRYFGSLMSIALLNCMLSTLVIMPSVMLFVTKVKSRFFQ